MNQKNVTVTGKYILIPIAPQKNCAWLEIFKGEEKLYEFKIPVSPDAGQPYSFSYYAPLLLEKYEEEKLLLKGELPEAFFEAICFSDNVPKRTDSHPSIHFAAQTGWINDPNGFFYKDGLYHLYFQYNPMNTHWANMSWGHAVSENLLYWKQKDSVLYPDGDGTMFSGSAIVNVRGEAGFPKDEPVFFYTCAGGSSQWSEGRPYTQKIAFSRDGGYTLEKCEGVAIDWIEGGNRDPKVYWHEESSGYYMVLYLDGSDYAIFRSDDLKKWTMTQRLTLQDAWECPDLREIPVEGGGSKWVFWSADGFYFVGDFDGYRFTPESGRQKAYATSLAYAAQTCWGTERVIIIPWLRSGNPKSLYTGVMGIPMQLTLVESDGGYVLRQRPVAELEETKVEIEAVGGKSETGKEAEKNVEGGVPQNDPGAAGEICYCASADAAVQLEVCPLAETDFAVNYGPVSICYSSETNTLAVKGCIRQPDEEKWRKEEQTRYEDGVCIQEVQLNQKPEKVSLIADHEILEIFVNDGMEYLAFETEYCGGCKAQDIAVRVQGNVRAYRAG